MIYECDNFDLFVVLAQMSLGILFRLFDLIINCRDHKILYRHIIIIEEKCKNVFFNSNQPSLWLLYAYDEWIF